MGLIETLKEKQHLQGEIEMELVKGILGVITGTQTSWIAQRPVYRHTSTVLAHKLRTLHLRQNKLKHFECTCILDTGQEIYAPKIKHIQTQKTEFGHCSLVTWVFESIDIKQHMTISKICIVDDLKVLVVENLLTDNFLCTPGDVFTLTDVTLSLS